MSINAHYDHHRALPGNEDQNDLFDSTDLTTPLNAELGRLIFSIGCHSGYAVPNFLYTSPFSLDWPEVDVAAGAIARVANTTYGYGDTEVIGYSESVEVAFASRLSQMTLGEALLYAKQQYVADLGSVGPFEQKAVNALTFYGLPMRQIGTPGGPVAPPPPPATTTDPITGLQSLAINSLVTFGAPVTAANGFYFTGPDGVDATNGRPYEPRKIVRDITQPGTIPHDFLLTGLGLDAPRTHFQAARSRAIPDSAGHTQPLSSQVGWPSSVSRIGSFASPTGPRQQLVLIHGQFLSDDDADTTGTGTQTNFNRITGNVLYSSSKDAIPPQLTKIRVTSVGSTVAFELDATDATSTSDNPPSGTVKAVVVVYYEPGASTAKTVLLSQTPGTTHWSGGGPLSSASSQEINYVIQAVDLGNVGLSVHKVVAAPVVLQQPQNGHLVITPSGTPAGGGWFGGNVSVTITPDPGFTASYSVDGGAITKYTAPFLVKGDGIHLVDAWPRTPPATRSTPPPRSGSTRRRLRISILSGRRTVRTRRAIAEGALQLPRLRDRSRRHERVRRAGAGRGQRRHDGRREDVHGDREGRARTRPHDVRLLPRLADARRGVHGADRQDAALPQAGTARSHAQGVTDAGREPGRSQQQAGCVPHAQRLHRGGQGRIVERAHGRTKSRPRRGRDAHQDAHRLYYLRRSAR